MTTAQFAILAVALFLLACAAFARSNQHERAEKTFHEYPDEARIKARLAAEGWEIVGTLFVCGFFFAAGIAAVRWVA